MKAIIENLRLVLSSAALTAALSGVGVSQAVWTAPPPPKTKIAVPPRVPMHGEDSEKSIKADRAVQLSLCVTQGRVKVNGWSRGEIRVMIDGGVKFAFNVRDKNLQTGDPNWVKVVSAEPKGRMGAYTDCLAGNVIEIDMPTGAKLEIKGTEMRASVDSVNRVAVETIGGNITLRNISAGIKAIARQGDIMVETSKGPIELGSTAGNIVVFEASPADIGDAFVAKTQGGTISLQGLLHRQVNVSSISGSVLYNGILRSGGSYSVVTSRGSIRMSLPADTSCQLQATYGYGNFISEIPLKLQTENISPGPIKSIVGLLGTGRDASLKLTTNNGSISIRKQ